jgi:hypothetical protein
MPIPYHLGGDPVVKLPQSAKSTRLFFREEGNILMPQLPNNPRLRFLIVETLSSSNGGSIGAASLLVHKAREETPRVGALFVQSVSISFQTEDERTRCGGEDWGRTLRVSPTFLAGVLSVPVPPVTAVVLPEEAMAGDMW